jgi:hypothetical protein
VDGGVATVVVKGNTAELTATAVEVDEAPGALVGDGRDCKALSSSRIIVSRSSLDGTEGGDSTPKRAREGVGTAKVDRAAVGGRPRVDPPRPLRGPRRTGGILITWIY